MFNKHFNVNGTKINVWEDGQGVTRVSSNNYPSGGPSAIGTILICFPIFAFICTVIKCVPYLIGLGIWFIVICILDNIVNEKIANIIVYLFFAYVIIVPIIYVFIYVG